MLPEEPPIDEFLLRLDDGICRRGRTRMAYIWSFEDWHLLQRCRALDVEEFCGSMLFENFIRRYGRPEQKRKLRILRSEFLLDLK